MPKSQFEPYRDQLEEWKSQGMPKIAMLRELDRQYPNKGFLDKQSSFYEFVDKIGGATVSDDQAARAFLAEVTDSLNLIHGTVNKLTQAVTEADGEAARRHEELLKRLASPSYGAAPAARLYGPADAALHPRVTWKPPGPRIPKWISRPVLAMLFLIAALLFATWVEQFLPRI